MPHSERPLKPLSLVVSVIPAVDPGELTAYMNASNVLINFAQGQARQIPAKSYDYLAWRRDVLTIAEPSATEVAKGTS